MSGEASYHSFSFRTTLFVICFRNQEFDRECVWLAIKQAAIIYDIDSVEIDASYVPADFGQFYCINFMSELYYSVDGATDIP